MKSYKFFHSSELACQCNKCDGEMDDIFMSLLIELREICDFSFHLSSAYRCPAHNKDVGASSRSAHVLGRAVDVIVSGIRARELIGKLPDGLTGVGLNQSGAFEERFIHLDNLSGSIDQPRPTVWTYK